MARRQLKFEYANLICHFADGGELLEHFADIFMPALESGDGRAWGDVRYEIIQPRMRASYEDGVCLYFRHLKRTKLVREQLVRENLIVPSPRSMDSDPTSFCVLILSNHRLIQVRENKGSPSLKELQTTIQRLVHRYTNTRFDEYVSRVETRAQKAAAKLEAQKLFPRSNIDLVPLTAEGEIVEALNAYQRVQSVRFTLIRPNNEIDIEGLFQGIRDQQAQVAAATSTLEHRSTDGLDIDAVAQEITAATKHGNARVVIKGEDHTGAPLQRNNQDLRVSRPAEESFSDATLSEKVDKMIKSLSSLASQSIIALGPPLRSAAEKATALYEAYKSKRDETE